MGSELTQSEKLIARVLFVNRLLRANGENFQFLFSAVMRAKHGMDFVAIQPQGGKGDGGNDGFLPDSGHYFQVYGPVDPESRIAYAKGKLATDFARTKANWTQTSKIERYSFAFNDKYLGTFPDIVTSLETLGKKEKIKCRPLTAADLESVFMELPAARIDDVLGQPLPDPNQQIRVDYSVLREVIHHIMLAPARSIATRFGELPSIDEKVELNNLCEAWRDIIRNGARHSEHVDLYYEKNSVFAKQALKDHLVAAYERCRNEARGLAKLPNGVSVEDIVFCSFFEALLPANANVSMQNAVEIIIGKFFEACDIFDPYAEKGAPSASP